ncbi:MAG: type IV toxin-antitoxin system AbiEi family antitoxin domain-containing protein [Candidatus Woesearchaeota archaeon]
MKLRETDLLVNRLHTTKERIIHRDRIKAFTSHPLEEALRALRRHGWISYVFEGYYYVLDADERYGRYTNYTDTEMLFATLNKRKHTWYLGLSGALERHGLVWQSHRTITIVTTSLSGRRKIRDLDVRFKRLRDDYFFGYESYRTKNRITTYYSDKEKTLIDYAYFNMKAPLELREAVNPATVASYLKNYPAAIKKRVLV